MTERADGNTGLKVITKHLVRTSVELHVKVLITLSGPVGKG